MAGEQQSPRSVRSFEVKIGGKSFGQSSDDELNSLVVEDHVDMADMLTLRVGASEGQPSWSFKIGDECTAKIESDTELFVGEIVALEPSFEVGGVSSITIRALDRTHRLGRGRRTRHWKDRKDSDVAQEVGAECGMTVVADSTSETLPYILQRNESNIAFLKRLAARNNYVLRVRAGKLEFKKVSYGGSGVTIEMGQNLRSVRFSFNSSEMVQSVVVRGWDIQKKEEIVGEATVSAVSKIGGGQVGASVAAKFGDSVGYVTDVPVHSQAMARTIAEAEMERLARQFCHGTATIAGTASITAGTIVTFAGLSKELNGKYFVVATRHIVSGRTGYLTELTFCSNTFGS